MMPEEILIKNKRIFITGGAGFIGSHLTRIFLENDNEVVIYDNMHRDAISNTDLAKSKNLTIIKGDVLDAGNIKKSIEGANIVIHLASIAGVDTVMKLPVLTMKTAILGTFNTLEASLTLPKFERFIDVSTSEVFGVYAYRVTEEGVTSLGAVGEARWTYAVSKLATEHLAHNYFKETGLPTVAIRPFNVFGPNQVGIGAIHEFIVRAIKGEEIIIHNDGDQIRSWCYIDDFTSGMILCLENQKAVGQSFNIGNPKNTLTIYNLAKEVVRISDSKSKIVHKKWDFPDVELRVPKIDKAREILGYEPCFDLETGLKRTLDWYKTKIK
jgi:nucleoside-diphosphate-sugar epimerase